MTPPVDWRRPGATVGDRLFAALAVLRIVVLLNAVAMNLYRAENFQRPLAGALVVAAMVGWTAFATYAYADPARRTRWLLVADLAVAVAAMASSPLLKGDGFNATVPGFWVAAALFAWAVQYGVLGGLAASVCLGATDLLIRDGISQAQYGNVFLILIGGPIVGFMASSLRAMAVERDRAERAAAAATERARLGRAVHDGVLQVLSLVQRRGSELGGEAAELGRLAGEQEASLRRLIRAQDAVDPETPGGVVDLAAALGALESATVTVAGPGTVVEVAEPVATELVAVVRACLDNVAVHVGPQAPAWVLLEAVGDRIAVAVRDEGPGIRPGRLEQAQAEGRLGVSGSIRGRIADLGGTAELSTGPFGTEWELTVPRGAGCVGSRP
ncbi:MacS family sensor histidine kinase [Nocardioides pantholopis]|uniref:MacS family sensor histidine kinase n=1 Tax=Nocardioides pantholopis TaxID=2483798 RepID=UPI0019CFE2D7|nr:DUF5931 domain-containing protein [Nocardioides pantholopis]